MTSLIQKNQNNTFYVQNSLCFVGNDMMWWDKAGTGYTSNLGQAQVFSKEEALQVHQFSKSDIPWPTHIVEAMAHKAVSLDKTNKTEIDSMLIRMRR